VAVASLYLARFSFTHAHRTAGKRLSLFLGLILIIQLAAGLTNVLLLAPVWMQVIHLFLADLVWISYILLAGETFSSQPAEAA
jgi:heme A synthase